MTQTIRKKMDIDEVKAFIEKQSPESKVYIGTDSERLSINGVPYADYMTVVVIHIDGRHGCKVFGEIVRERVYDQKKERPAQRLMTEVYKTAEMYQKLVDVISDKNVEIHLDIASDKKHGSHCVYNEAIGYIRGTCNIIPMVKPNSWAASFCGDRYGMIAADVEKRFGTK